MEHFKGMKLEDLVCPDCKAVGKYSIEVDRIARTTCKCGIRRHWPNDYFELSDEKWTHQKKT